MGKLAVEALKWGFGFWIADKGVEKVADKVGDGLGEGTRNALTIAALGAVAYVLLRKA